MMGGTQDRIIVHASRDIFDDGPHAMGPSQRSRSSCVAVKPGRGETAGRASRKKHSGYADRHIQRRVQQESSPKRAQHRAQPQVGSTAQQYFLPAPERAASTQPGLAELHDSMAATGLDDGTRTPGHTYMQAPPHWRRISAVAPSHPQQDYSTGPSVGHESRGRLWQSNEQHHDDSSRRLPAGEDTGSSNRFPDHAGVTDIGVRCERRASGEPGRFGEGFDHRTRTEQDTQWGGVGRQHIAPPQDDPYPSEEPEHQEYHHGPETRSRPRCHDEYGKADGEFPHRDGGRERGGNQSNRQHVNHHRESGSGGGGQDGKRQGVRSGGRGSQSPPGRYGQPQRNGDAGHEHKRHLPEGGETVCNPRTPRDSSSSGSSDQRLSGRRDFAHAGVGEESIAAGKGRSMAKRVEFSSGLQGLPSQKASVRKQLASPETMPLPTASAPPRPHMCTKISPARRRRPQTEALESPVSTGPRPCAEDIEDKTTPASLNEALVKTPKDMLLFSKKARQVDYKPCTLKEYRETKPTGYVELGKLQPDLYTDELIAKRANAERIKEFSANLRKINSDTAAARGGTDHHRNQKGPAQDSRSRGLAFARRIPHPKKVRVQRPAADASNDPADPSARRRAGRQGNNGLLDTEGWTSRGSTELENLQALHDDMRKKVQASRSSF